MILTVRDAAKLLGTTEDTLYRWVSKGSIPFLKIREQCRFNRAELLEWAMANGVRISTSDFSASESVRPPLLSVSHMADALMRGGVHEHVEGSDRDSVLRAVVKRMPVPDEDRELLFDVLVARESLGSTGIGDGIAIPHVRSPVVLHTQPSITLSYLDHVVDFAAIDGKPVHTVFSMVTPTLRLHLHLLSRLASALHDSGFRDAVTGKAAATEVLREAQRVESTFAKPPPSNESR